MQRTSLAKLVGLGAGQSSLLDGVAVTYSSQMENTLQGPDSVFGAQDWRNLKIRNGLKHNIKLSSSSSVGFVSLAPTFTYNQYDSFQRLDVSEVQLGADSVGLLTDTLGVSIDQRMAFGRVSEHAFYGLFNLLTRRVKVSTCAFTQPWIELSTRKLRDQTLVTADDEVNWNPYALGRYVPTDRREAGSLNFSLGQNLEAKVADRLKLKRVKILDNLSTSGATPSEVHTLGFVDTGVTSLFNRVDIPTDATTRVFSRFLDQQGSVPRFRRRRGGGISSASQGHWSRLNSARGSSNPWNLRLNYNVNLARSWVSALGRDTSAVTHAISARGLQCGAKVQGGRHLLRFGAELTPTNLNFYVDLHCWSFPSIDPIRSASFSLRLNVK